MEGRFVDLGIGLVGLGADLPAPVVEALAQALDAPKVGGGQVAAFAGIGLEVVEFGWSAIIGFQILPASDPNGATRTAALVGVMREVPEQGTPRRFSATRQPAGHTPSIEVGRNRLAGEFEKRREPVGIEEGFVGDAVGGEAAGPADDQRDSQAALVKEAFAGAEGPVVGDASVAEFRHVQSSVVAGEDHQGLRSQPEFIEAGDQATHGFVEGFDQGRVDGFEGPRVGLDEVAAGVVRDMRGMMGEVEEERSLAVLFDELDGPIGQIEFTFSAFGLRRFGIGAAGVDHVEATALDFGRASPQVPFA